MTGIHGEDTSSSVSHFPYATGEGSEAKQHVALSMYIDSTTFKLTNGGRLRVWSAKTAVLSVELSLQLSKCEFSSGYTNCRGRCTLITCRFCNVTCRHRGKMGKIASVLLHSSSVIPEQLLNSALITVNKTADSDDRHTPPVFQLTKLDRHLHLVTDIAPLFTFINTKTWIDLHQPKSEASYN